MSAAAPWRARRPKAGEYDDAGFGVVAGISRRHSCGAPIGAARRRPPAVPWPSRKGPVLSRPCRITLRPVAKLTGRQRDLIRATGVVGDPIYIPCLTERMAVPETARLAGEAFSMITGLDLAYRDLDRESPRDFESGPNDDPADENVALDADENLPWPDPAKIGDWWLANLGRFTQGTGYFLGRPKPAVDWLEVLSDAFQRQRHAAAPELAIPMPQATMFEVRARGRLQRRLIARAREAGH